MSVDALGLSPNSLYVGTNQIMAGAPGKFHWFFYLTNDAALRASKVHWSTMRPNTGSAEDLLWETISPPRTFNVNGDVTFTCVRIDGFRAGPHPDSKFEDMVQDVFDPPHGYATILKNRSNGLTCRTWVLAVMERLVREGWIVREEGKHADMVGFEKFVVDLSVKMESACAVGVFEETRVTEY